MPRTKPPKPAEPPTPAARRNLRQEALELVDNGMATEAGTRALVLALLAVREGLDNVEGQLDFVAGDVEQMRKLWT